MKESGHSFSALFFFQYCKETAQIKSGQYVCTMHITWPGLCLCGWHCYQFSHSLAKLATWLNYNVIMKVQLNVIERGSSNHSTGFAAAIPNALHMPYIDALCIDVYRQIANKFLKKSLHLFYMPPSSVWYWPLSFGDGARRVVDISLIVMEADCSCL